MWAKAQVLLTTISFSSLAFMVDLWNQDYNTMFISRTPRPSPSQEVENFGIFSSYGGLGKIRRSWGHLCISGHQFWRAGLKIEILKIKIVKLKEYTFSKSLACGETN